MRAWRVAAALTLLAFAAARRSDPDFEFDDDTDSRGPGGRSNGPRRYIYDPHNPLCSTLSCGSREVCVLREGRALCADKRDILRRGDTLVASGARDDDEDVFYDEPEPEPVDKIDSNDTPDDVPDANAENRVDRCVGCGGAARGAFLCGSDNRTYSSLCRLDLHNCVRRPASPVTMSCRGFCPCPTPRPHKDRTLKSAKHLSSYDDYDEAKSRDISSHNEVWPHQRRGNRRRNKQNKVEGCALERLADRLLDWFSVLMDDARATPPPRQGHTSNYVWVDEDIESSRQAFLKGLSTGLRNPQKGRRLIVTHIGSEDGFLEGGESIFQAKKTDSEGDYHGEMDAETFEKWFKKILEKIEPGSVIVLDNAPYHSRRLDRIPNMSWRKADIQAWLTEKNIQFEEREIKAQLLAKFDKEKYQKKYIDELAASMQILVLRLPPYHCELNPIELIWAQLKGFVGRNNKTFKLDEVEKLVKDGINRIGTESWKKCVEHIKKKEDEMMRLDGIIDDITDGPTPEFVIHVGESSSDDDYETSCSE